MARTAPVWPLMVLTQTPVLNSQTLRLVSYEPEMTRSLAWSIWTQRTVSVWPTMVTLQAMLDQLTEMDRSHTLMVRSVLPLTRRFPSKIKVAGTA